MARGLKTGAICLLLVATALTAGCGTLEGFQRDVKSVGRALSN